MKASKVGLVACALSLSFLVGLALRGGEDLRPSHNGGSTPSTDAPDTNGRDGEGQSRGGGLARQRTVLAQTGLDASLQPPRAGESGRIIAGTASDAAERARSPHPDAGMRAGVPQEPARSEQRGPGAVCATSSDCPEGLGCIFEPTPGRFSCQPSECKQDADCADGKVCRVASDITSGVPIRRCLIPGTQREGGACFDISSDSSEVCRAGLLCVRGRCGKPCEESTIGSCPVGSTCISTVNGGGCLATCREGQCPNGQECLDLGDESLCANRVGENCLTGGCAKGQVCEVTQRMDTVIFECAKRCDPFQPEGCLPGSVCGAGGNGQSLCYQGCDFTENPCPRGYECSTVTEDLRTLGCRRVGP